MNFLNSILFVLISTLTVSIYGQSELFNDINSVEKISEDKDMKVFYFHYEACPPCKRMDKEVFSQESVKSFMKNSFNCYSVNGYDSLETHYRTLFDVKSNPSFLFVDKNNTVKHKIVGYYDSESFIAECKKATSNENLYSFESEYLQTLHDLLFMREYIYIKENAGELSNDLIDLYLEMIPKDSLTKEDYLTDVLHLGYYRGKRTLDYNSDLFKYLSILFKNGKTNHYKEDIRCRIIFSINDKLYDPNLEVQDKMSLIEEMSKYEDDNKILLRDINNEKYYALFEDKYPSYMYKYSIALENDDKVLASNIFKEYLNKIYSEHEDLNRLAWGIFKEDYKEDLNLGIDIIKRALELNEHYNYYDTYASLLYKSGKLKQAKEMAVKSINLAKKNEAEFGETKNLLNKIIGSLAKG